MPPGFAVKTALLTIKPDGFYVSLSLEDKSVPNFVSKVVPKDENSIGIDLGLEKIVSTSTGKLILPPKYFRASQNKLALMQQKASEKNKGSRARKLLYRKLAKLHHKDSQTKETVPF